MRNAIAILVLILAAIAASGCMQMQTRLNPGQEPAIYTANRDWVQMQPVRRFCPARGQLGMDDWIYSWQDPATKAIYLCQDTGPRIRAAELAKYGVALPTAKQEPTP